jgi:hypothetical protein
MEKKNSLATGKNLLAILLATGKKNSVATGLATEKSQATKKLSCNSTYNWKNL